MSDWINSDTMVLHADRHAKWTQCAVGNGKVSAHIEKAKLNYNIFVTSIIKKGIFT